MRNELRYQAKIHAISDMPRNEKIIFPAFYPPFFFKKENNKKLAIKIKPVKDQNYQYRKIVA
jgi:hypothetical protein